MDQFLDWFFNNPININLSLSDILNGNLDLLFNVLRNLDDLLHFLLYYIIDINRSLYPMLDLSLDYFIDNDLLGDFLSDYILNNNRLLYYDINIFEDWNLNGNLNFLLDDFLYIDFSFHFPGNIVLNDPSRGDLDDLGDVHPDLLLNNHVPVDWLLDNLVLMDIVNHSVKNHGSLGPVELNVLLVNIDDLFLHCMILPYCLIRSLNYPFDWFINIDFILNWNLDDLLNWDLNDLLYRNLNYFLNWSLNDDLVNSLLFKVPLNGNVYINIHWNVHIGIVGLGDLLDYLYYLLFSDFLEFLLLTFLGKSWSLGCISLIKLVF